MILDEIRDVLEARLPKSQHKKVEVILADLEHLDESFTHAVIPAAAAPIETVEAYGLVIKVDANGCAAEVDFWTKAFAE